MREISVEDVRYHLGAGTIMMAVNHQEMDDLIAYTVAKLPQEVQEFVFDNCCFATMGDGISGQAIPPNTHRWLVHLDANMLKTFLPSECQSIIAHEIAHALLGHNMGDPKLTIDCEREAAEQTAAWGFEGIGADPELYFKNKDL